MSDPEQALIKAIAEAICARRCDSRFSPAPWQAHEREARAAYAAMVEHLGLVEEWGVRFERQADPTMGNPSGGITVEQKVNNEATARGAVKNGAPISAKNRRVVRRLASRWAEVDHGSE